MVDRAKHCEKSCTEGGGWGVGGVPLRNAEKVDKIFAAIVVKSRIKFYSLAATTTTTTIAKELVAISVCLHLPFFGATCIATKLRNKLREQLPSATAPSCSMPRAPKSAFVRASPRLARGLQREKICMTWCFGFGAISNFCEFYQFWCRYSLFVSKAVLLLFFIPHLEIISSYRTVRVSANKRILEAYCGLIRTAKLG